MKLSNLFFITQFIAFVFAASVTFNSNGGEEDLIIKNNSEFSVELKGNPTTGYSWYLKNADEIKKSNVIKAINLNKSKTADYKQDNARRGMVGVGGTFTFKFQTKDVSKGDLPTLQFVYTRNLKRIRKDDTTAIVNLLNDVVVPEPIPEPEPEKESLISFTGEGGKQELNVDSNTIVTVQLKGNPTTGYAWYLENATEIEESKAIESLNDGEYIQEKALAGVVGVGGTYVYKFKINEIEGELPTLNFVYKRSWVKGSIATATVELKHEAVSAAVAFEVEQLIKPLNEPKPIKEEPKPIKEEPKPIKEEPKPIKEEPKPIEEPIEEPVEEPTEESEDDDMIVFSSEGGNEEIAVESNSSFTVKLEGNPTTGYSWYLDNVDEIKESVIEAVNLNESNSGDYIQNSAPAGMVGVGGSFIFQFKVNEIQGELPQLKFVYKRPWETKNPISEATVTLVSGDDVEDVSTDNYITFTNEGGKEEIVVESNTSLTVELEGNPTTGYSWYLDNVDEIKESVIEAVNLNENNSGDYAQDQAPAGMVGVGGSFTFIFKIKEIQGELPQLKFVYKRPWETKDPIYEATVTLNVSSNETVEEVEEVEEEKVPEEIEYDEKVSFNDEGGKKELTINGNSTVAVELEGNITTGYTWVLENVEEIQDSDAIEALNLDENNSSLAYMEKKNDELLDGVGGTFVFQFKIKTFCPKDLPKLKFAYKRIWETGKAAATTAEVTLVSEDKECGGEEMEEEKKIEKPVEKPEEEEKKKIEKQVEKPEKEEKKIEKPEEKEEVKVIKLDYKDTKSEIKVKDNESFDVEVKGNISTGYVWYLLNEEELIEAGITPLNLNEYKTGDYVSPKLKGLLGASGTFIFKFKVDKVTEALPSIKLIYRRSWIPIKESDSRIEISLKPE